MRAALRDLRRVAMGPDYPPIGPPPRWWPRWRVIAMQVGVLALLGLGASATAYLNENRELPPPIAGFIAFATILPVAAAFRRPLLAWRLSFAGLFLGVADADPAESWPWNPVQILGFLLVLALTATRAEPGVVAWIGALSIIPVFLLVNQANAYGVAVLFLAVLIVGDQIRRRRQSQRALVEQAELSELEKARRAVLEERTRIAREMHDVVAHHMSMIAVQAETAPYRLTAVPDPARAEFVAIAGSARGALTDMRRLLGVLRSESVGPERAPQPGLDDLPDLLEGARPGKHDGGPGRPRAFGPRRAGRPRAFGPGRAGRPRASGPGRAGRHPAGTARGGRTGRVPDRPGGAGQRRPARPGRAGAGHPATRRAGADRAGRQRPRCGRRAGRAGGARPDRPAGTGRPARRRVHRRADRLWVRGRRPAALRPPYDPADTDE